MIGSSLLVFVFVLHAWCFCFAFHIPNKECIFTSLIGTVIEKICSDAGSPVDIHRSSAINLNKRVVKFSSEHKTRVLFEIIDHKDDGLSKYGNCQKIKKKQRFSLLHSIVSFTFNRYIV